METLTLIDSLLAARNSPAKILETLRAHGLPKDALRASAPEPISPYPYSRRTLAASADCEVMLARWSAGRACAPHDHGNSAGWVFFIDGRFRELDFRENGGGLAGGAEIVHEAGSHVAVRPDEIHSCVCDDFGLSLHVYYPRIRGMRVFDLARRRTLVVADECGAWVPASSEHIRKVTAWSTANPIAAS